MNADGLMVRPLPPQRADDIARAFLPHEFRHFGISQDESQARFREGLEQIELLLTRERATHRGRFHSFENVTSLPRPTQKPRPKFYIAATQTPESFEFAGSEGYSLMAIPIGVYSARHQYSRGDYFFTLIGFIGLGIPSFMIALVLMWVAFRYLGLDVGGLYSPEYRSAPWSFGKVLDLGKHFWIPLVIVGLVPGVTLTENRTLLPRFTGFGVPVALAMLGGLTTGAV